MLGTWREQHLPQIVANLANRPRHESVRTLVADILRYGFDVDYHQIDHEVRLPEVHGRADLAPLYSSSSATCGWNRATCLPGSPIT